jgi:cytochrome c556
MKLMKTMTFVALLSVAGMAENTLPTNMIESETGLANIQKGFLYNSVEMIKKGAVQIKTANAIFHDAEATKSYLPSDKSHMSNIAFNAAKRIDTAVDEMLLYLDAKEMNKAQNSYSHIISACGSCHAVVRGW